MPAYKIETTYHLPVYRQRSYEADMLEEACRAAIADEGWDDGEEDVDTSGESAAAVPRLACQIGLGDCTGRGDLGWRSRSRRASRRSKAKPCPCTFAGRTCPRCDRCRT